VINLKKVINLKRARKSNRLLKALTGLKREEFLRLAVVFGKNIEEVFKETRKVALNLGRPFVLKTAEEKLFFILFYMKCYPTFDLAGFIFNVDRSSCCRWVNWFLPVLTKTLGKELERERSVARKSSSDYFLRPRRYSLMVPKGRDGDPKTLKSKRETTLVRRNAIR